MGKLSIRSQDMHVIPLIIHLGTKVIYGNEIKAHTMITTRQIQTTKNIGNLLYKSRRMEEVSFQVESCTGKH